MEWVAQIGQNVLDFLIPPTERSQLDWKSNFDYNKNQIIIIDEKLFFYANNSFKSKINLIHLIGVSIQNTIIQNLMYIIPGLNI